MSGITIDEVPRDGWAALAPFILASNLRPDGKLRCLHCEHGETAPDLAAEMAGLPEGEAMFIAARREGQLLGMIGAEMDPALGRAWLRGPLVDRDAAGTDAPATARSLIAALRQRLPPTTVRMDAFPQADEALLCEAYAAEGFEDRLVNHVLTAKPPSTLPAWPDPVIDSLDDAAATQRALAVHAEAFPEGYLTPQTLLSTRDGDHRLLVTRDGAGYLYVQHDRECGEGYIDFLGVAPSARGRGLGRALIDAAAHWIFVAQGLPRLSLTVRSDRAPALALYRRAGFVEVAAGRHLCGLRSA